MRIQILYAALGMFVISSTVSLAVPVAKFDGGTGSAAALVADKKGDSKKMKPDNDAKKTSSKSASGDSAKLYSKWKKLDKRPEDWNKKACVTADGVWYCR